MVAAPALALTLDDDAQPDHPAPAPRALNYAEARALAREEHEARVGRTIGHWRVVVSLNADGGTLIYGCVCTGCGAEVELTTSELIAGEPCLEAECFAGVPLPVDQHTAERLARLAAVPSLDADTRWADDVEARAWAAEHPESTLEELGKAFDLSRERVRQIEERALRKVGRFLLDRGYGAEDVGALFGRRRR